MTDKARKLAEQVALTSLSMNVLGMQNTHTDPALRVKQDAEFRMAKDAYLKALSEYQSHIQSMSSEELRALATTPPQSAAKE